MDFYNKDNTRGYDANALKVLNERWAEWQTANPDSGDDMNRSDVELAASERILRAYDSEFGSEPDTFRLAGEGLSKGDVLEAWSTRFSRWERIAEFDSYLSATRTQMIVNALNANDALVADWND